MKLWWRTFTPLQQLGILSVFYVPAGAYFWLVTGRALYGTAYCFGAFQCATLCVGWGRSFPNTAPVSRADKIAHRYISATLAIREGRADAAARRTILGVCAVVGALLFFLSAYSS